MHDPSAAVVVDGKVVAAAEEERFVRKKHAIGLSPVEAIKYCLSEADLDPGDIDAVAFPWSTSEFNRKKWHYAARTILSEPSRVYEAFTKFSKDNANIKRSSLAVLKGLGFDIAPEKVYFVEHHMAHASSAYHLSGFPDAAIMTIDGSGEFTSVLFARGSGGKIEKIKEIDLPDSLGRFYSTMTAYLGFQPGDGEYKLMGMAPYGDPGKCDLSGIIDFDDKGFKTNPEYVWPVRSRRYAPDGMIPKKLVERFGPPRKGDDLGEPYIHIAAATQKIFEDIILRLMHTYLGDDLKKTGKLAFAGGCALNVALNRRLSSDPLVKEFFVQPASHDAGTPLGAAVYTANSLGDEVSPMDSVYLGPSYTDPEIEAALQRDGISYKRSADIEKEVAKLIAEDSIVGWFQGRMEFGPRALGNRSILGNPMLPGTSDRINETVKFREKWRPFCPSILREYSRDIIGSDTDAPFMTFSFTVTEGWRKKIPEVVHVDGTARAQTVTMRQNPRFYGLLKNFYALTGVPVLINTSLNRRGEPMAASPADAVNMYLDSGLDYLAIGDFLVQKKGRA